MRFCNSITLNLLILILFSTAVAAGEDDLPIPHVQLKPDSEVAHLCSETIVREAVEEKYTGSSAVATLHNFSLLRDEERFRRVLVDAGVDPGRAEQTAKAMQSVLNFKNGSPVFRSLLTYLDKPERPPLLVSFVYGDVSPLAPGGYIPANSSATFYDVQAWMHPETEGVGDDILHIRSDKPNKTAFVLSSFEMLFLPFESNPEFERGIIASFLGGQMHEFRHDLDLSYFIDEWMKKNLARDPKNRDAVFRHYVKFDGHRPILDEGFDDVFLEVMAALITIETGAIVRAKGDPALLRPFAQAYAQHYVPSHLKGYQEGVHGLTTKRALEAVLFQGKLVEMTSQNYLAVGHDWFQIMSQTVDAH